MDDDRKKEKQREYARKRRANETPEQREARLAKQREYMRQRRDNALHEKWLKENKICQP